MEVRVLYKNKTFPMSAEGIKKQSIQVGPSQNEDNPVFSPMELVLVSLAGCSSIDVVDILKKQRQELKELQVKVEASRKDAIPAVFADINLHFILQGELQTEKVTRAIDLSLNKYCSVAQMLKHSVEITTSFEINSNTNN